MSQSQYYLTRLEVQARYKASRSSIYRWIEQGLFPPPIKLGPRMVRWKSTDLEEFERERDSGSDISKACR